MYTPDAAKEHHADTYQVQLEKMAQALEQITHAVESVVEAYVKGCQQNGYTPAKYITSLQTQVQRLAETVADAANAQETVFNNCLHDLHKTLCLLEETGEVVTAENIAINPYYRRASGKPFWADMSPEQLQVVLQFLHADQKQAASEMEIYAQLIPFYEFWGKSLFFKNTAYAD